MATVDASGVVHQDIPLAVLVDGNVCSGNWTGGNAPVASNTFVICEDNLFFQLLHFAAPGGFSLTLSERNAFVNNREKNKHTKTMGKMCKSSSLLSLKPLYLKHGLGKTVYAGARIPGGGGYVRWG